MGTHASQAGSAEHKLVAPHHHGMTQPKQGDVYRCPQCGMELKITSDCHCERVSDIRLECCGQPLIRA